MATETRIPSRTSSSSPRLDGFRGELIEPGDPGYDAARAVYNGMIDRHPRLIARCADVVDVAAAVELTRESGLPLAVRGGGHNAGGLGVWDDAVVIDLSAMRGVRVDPATHSVRASTRPCTSTRSAARCIGPAPPTRPSPTGARATAR